ncbi:sodium/glutamate symporter [Megasphaera sp. DJF_B143]|uniref:sodium/glutamate symporter n=1 Tax=Megasphaera sp. DJF_B143 TaxID=537288 RepID=UPI00124313DC|nr:sodium/glutamate symporter [Megasphaera sp. DJF_B143]
MTVTNFLIDFFIASVFILIGQLLRSKVGFIQRFFMPSAMVAGLLALAVRYTGILPFSKGIGSYPGTLIILIFAAIGLQGFTIRKNDMKKEVARLGSYFCYKTLAQAIQFSLPVIFSILVISQLFPDINYAFGLLLASGFSGGHGTAAAVGSALAQMGFEDAKDIGMTCATVGLLAGIFGGLIYTKMAARRGYTAYIKDFSYISGDLKTGLISKENRQSMGDETISSTTLDTLAFHLALLLTCSGAGWFIMDFIYKSTGLDLPSYLFAFLLGVGLFLILKRTPAYDYIDNRVISRISCTATDYLVFFGIASIKIPVVIEYAVPLLMLLIVGMIIVTYMLWVVGPQMNNESWFERSLFVYGYSTGVFAIGFVLLRIVDPDNKSKTLNDTAIVGSLNTPFEMFAWSFGPIMLMQGQHWLFAGLYLALTIACFVVCKACGWWWGGTDKHRPGLGTGETEQAVALEAPGTDK